MSGSYLEQEERSVKQSQELYKNLPLIYPLKS